MSDNIDNEKLVPAPENEPEQEETFDEFHYDPTLCTYCQEHEREDGSFYCAECRAEMLKTKVKGGSVLALILSVAVSFCALLIFSLNCTQAVHLMDAELLARDGYISAALNSVSKAQSVSTQMSELAAVSAVSDTFGGQEIFSLGKVYAIALSRIYALGYTEIDAGNLLSRNFGEEEALSDPQLFSVRRYIKEYSLYNTTLTAAQNILAPYESTVADTEMPYDDVIAQLDALKAQEGIGAHYVEYYKCYASILAEKDYDVQLSHLLEMEKLYPEGIIVYGPMIADCYYNLGEYDKAAEYADKMIARNKNFSSAYEQKFLCYLASGEETKALEVCEALDELSTFAGTDSGDYTQYSLRAHFYRLKKDYDAALEQCTEGLEISGGDAEIYRQQAIIYLLQGKISEAATAMDNSYQEAYYSTGLTPEILNTAVLCARLSGADEMYTTASQILTSNGYDLSEKVQDCIDGKISVEDIFLSGVGEIL